MRFTGILSRLFQLIRDSLTESDLSPVRARLELIRNSKELK